MPDEKADYIDLGVYIKKHLQAGDRSEDQAAGFGRRTTIHRWYAGAALKIIQDRETKGRKWVEWCKNHGFNLGTCYEAIRLFQRAGGVENVRELSITEARKKYQTNKKTFILPGAKPEPGPKAQQADKDAPKIDFKDTEHLARLRKEMESVFEAVMETTEDDWRQANPREYVMQIDTLVAKLRQARRAIREAYKESLKQARTTMKTTSKVGAKGTVKPAAAAKKRPS